LASAFPAWALAGEARRSVWLYRGRPMGVRISAALPCWGPAPLQHSRTRFTAVMTMKDNIGSEWLNRGRQRQNRSGCRGLGEFMSIRTQGTVKKYLAAATAAAVLQAVAAPAQTTRDAKATIPLCPGLTIVTAISQPQGDYESIKRIGSVTADAVRIRYSSYMPDPCCEYSGHPLDPPWVPFVVHRTVRKADLESSTRYLQQFVSKGVPETVKGTTALGISTKSFRDLRDTGRTPLTIYMPFHPKFGIKDDGTPLFFGVDPRMAGELARVDPTPVAISVLVNDRMTTLPALRARGKFLEDDAEFFFLYDEANPISLKFRIGIKGPMPPEIQKVLKEAAGADVCDGCAQLKREYEDRDVLQVVKITHKCEGQTLTMKPGGAGGAAPGGGGERVATGAETGSGGGSAVALLEESLANTGRAEVYSIYFAFNSDEIREESEPTLLEIADVLRRHPDWKLAIEGHTDSIATDAYNLQLSQKRAAAVRNALVSKKEVAGARLTTAGFGESRPKDTNDTLEGRARNRRVELVRTP
jgi:outer membrane protein OmpA-like peptidoglycan-associated protein